MKDNQVLLTLIRHAAGGNTDAFSDLVKELEAPVYRLAFSIMGNREDAKDIAQETFLKLWRTLGTFRGDASVTTYVLTVVKNTALDELRRRRGKVIESLTVTEDNGTERQADLTDMSSNPALAYERKERIEGVRQAISELPEDQRAVLTLRDIEGYSYDAISDILGLNEGTVKSRLFRARQTLKEILIKRKIY